MRKASRPGGEIIPKAEQAYPMATLLSVRSCGRCNGKWPSPARLRGGILRNGLTGPAEGGRKRRTMWPHDRVRWCRKNG